MVNEIDLRYHFWEFVFLRGIVVTHGQKRCNQYRPLAKNIWQIYRRDYVDECILYQNKSRLFNPHLQIRYTRLKYG